MTVLNQGQATPIKFVGTCSEIVDIDTIFLNPNNNKTIRNYQGEQQETEKEDLYNSIIEEGLRNPILVYENSNLVVGGHNRYNVLKEVGCTKVPVSYIERSKEIVRLFGETGEIDPNNYWVLRDLASDNISITQSVYAKYETIKNAISALETELGREITWTERKAEIKFYGMGLNTYEMMAGLENGFNHKKLGFIGPRLDLLQELREQKDGKTAKGQCKSQLDDHALLFDPTKKFYERDTVLENALETFNWDALTNTINEELAYLRKRSWFTGVPDRNFKSATSHHIIVHNFVEVFNALDNSYTASAVPNGGRYDVHFSNAKGELVNTLEVKTTLNTGWTTANEKYGYAILFKFSDEMDRCFLMNVYLDRNWNDNKGFRLWKQAGAGNLTLKLPDLYSFTTESDTFINVPYGELYMENGVVRTATDSMI